MTSIMNARKFLFTILLSYAILFASFKPAAACQPTLPDWWFSERIETSIDPDRRPPGLSIRSKNGGVHDNLAQIYIGNNIGSRIYLATNSILNNTTLEQPLSGLPSGYTVFELLRGGQTTSYNINELQNFLTDFTDHNIQAPERPPNVDIPAPQSDHLYILYEEQLISVPITLSYSLNPDYNPRNGVDGCGNMIFLMPLFLISAGIEWGVSNGVLICGSFLGVVGIIYFWKLKNKNV